MRHHVLYISTKLSGVFLPEIEDMHHSVSNQQSCLINCILWHWP